MIKKLITLIPFIIAIILTGLFIMQFSELLLTDNRFVIFQIILSFVWGVGACVFWIIGFATYRISKKQ